MTKCNPGQGGCWYCYDDENTEEKPLYFSWEFDTYIHLDCIKNELIAQKELDLVDPELDIIANEFKELLNGTY